MKPTAYVDKITSGTQPRKYDKNGKGLYLLFDGNDEMRYKYNLSIKSIWMDRFLEQD